jgi:hypothetical protein
MIQFGLISIGAGAAATLLFASITSGTLLSIPLFYLAPLPIMIAGVGWSHWAALSAVIIAALALAMAFGGAFFLTFRGAVGAPAWCLSYLTMLARPIAANPEANGPITGTNTNLRGAVLEWYPPGRLVVWSALLAALVIVATIPKFGFDAESFRAGLHDALARMLQINTLQTGNGAAPGQSGPAAGIPNPQRLLDFFVEVGPPAAAVVAALTSLVNLWLAAHVVKFSGRLARPWPSISTMTFPRQVLILLAATIALSFTDGLLGIIALILSASLLTAYGVLGFAVMHDITRGIAGRLFLLAGVYAAVLIIVWPMLALCLLGLAEAIFGLRARATAKDGPPQAR